MTILPVLDGVALGVAGPAVEIAAVEERREPLGRLGLRHRRRGLVAGDLADEDVPERERIAVGLELDLPRGVDRLVPLPIILQDDVVDDELVVEIDADALADHDDPERVPLADRAVGLFRGDALALLVVVEAARADGVGRRVPDLDLGRAAEIEAAVAALLDLPVGQKLEIAVVGRGAEALALAVEDERPVGDPPVGPHPLVGRGLGRGQLRGRHLGPGRRVGDQALPAVERAAVEEGHEAALAKAGRDERGHALLLGRVGRRGPRRAGGPNRPRGPRASVRGAPVRTPDRGERRRPFRRARDGRGSRRAGAAIRAPGRPRRRRRSASCPRLRTAWPAGSWKRTILR